MIASEALEHRRSGRITDDMLPDGFSWAHGGTAIKHDASGHVHGLSNVMVIVASDVPAMLRDECRRIQWLVEN